MTGLYLLDTNVVSEPLRPSPQAKVLQLLQKFHTQLALASIVWHELWFGCQRLPASTRQTAIRRYLEEVVSTLTILPYDQRAAEWHAAERARLVVSGQTPPFSDGQIAAIAAVNDLTLVTFNVADYANFQGLKLESWRK